MSKQIEAMNLALEALENLPEMCGIEEAITAIRDALMSVPDGAQSRSDEEQPAQQQSAERVEPVEYWTVADGWVSEQAEVPAAVWVESDFWEHCNRVNCGTAYRLPAPGRQPLYKSPPASKPLTDEEILAANYPDGEENGPTIAAPNFELICFARQIEAKLKEKNNG